MPKILPIKLYNFDSIVEFTLWQPNYLKIIPESGEVYAFKIRDIDKMYIKIGNGKDYLADLPNVEFLI